MPHLSRIIGFVSLGGLLLLVLGSVPDQPGCDWQTVTSYPPIDTARADTVLHYQNTPASVVGYFYASQIRGDQQWEQVVQKDRIHPRTFEAYERWGVRGVKLIEQCQRSSTRAWVKVNILLLIGPSRDRFEDEVTVEKINGHWRITDLPN